MSEEHDRYLVGHWRSGVAALVIKPDGEVVIEHWVKAICERIGDRPVQVLRLETYGVNGYCVRDDETAAKTRNTLATALWRSASVAGGSASEPVADADLTGTVILVGGCRNLDFERNYPLDDTQLEALTVALDQLRNDASLRLTAGRDQDRGSGARNSHPTRRKS